MRVTSTFRRGRNADKARRPTKAHPRLESLEDRRLQAGGLASIDFSTKGDRPVQDNVTGYARADMVMVRSNDLALNGYVATSPTAAPAGLAGTSKAVLATTLPASVQPIVVWTTLNGSQTTIHFKVYDATRSAWKESSAVVDGGLLNLTNQGGVIAWSSVAYGSLGRIDHNTVAYSTYDAARGSWSNQSTVVAGSLLSITNQNGVVTWLSSGSGNVSRIYDRPSGTWRKF